MERLARTPARAAVPRAEVRRFYLCGILRELRPERPRAVLRACVDPPHTAEQKGPHGEVAVFCPLGVDVEPVRARNLPDRGALAAQKAGEQRARRRRVVEPVAVNDDLVRRGQRKAPEPAENAVRVLHEEQQLVQAACGEPARAQQPESLAEDAGARPHAQVCRAARLHGGQGDVFRPAGNRPRRRAARAGAAGTHQNAVEPARPLQLRRKELLPLSAGKGRCQQKQNLHVFSSAAGRAAKPPGARRTWAPSLTNSRASRYTPAKKHR